MGLFDDIIGKVTELTGSGQDAIDSASQTAEDLQSQAEEHVTNITEQLPEDPTGITDHFFGSGDEK